MAPQPRPGRGDGVELLVRDSVQEEADKAGGDYEALNLSGAIDILQQLKSGVPPPTIEVIDAFLPL